MCIYVNDFVNKIYTMNQCLFPVLAKLLTSHLPFMMNYFERSLNRTNSFNSKLNQIPISRRRQSTRTSGDLSQLLQKCSDPFLRKQKSKVFELV